ncbi:hypothetical protein DY124_06135 [Apilactobacillus micheneri]|uniref:hypothetical protein n=1 Tax=Apilactobacillus micheneri TaxID=1899430 RepID=UPI00112C162E|nr:hypothetical protein [Apilactobacillus micheneri]TPR43153.1 hypothetical protein DY124_06135 [Apilactobacillus micheneri]TPR47241.1 hypothetical protein DY125_06630 [Apilactobacillus micheneri]
MPSLTQTAEDKSWDVADIIIEIDGVAVDLATTGDLFTCSFDNDNITISVDVWGNGMRVINHNAQATITVNVSRLSNMWKKFLDDNNNDRTAQHKINILTPVERITTSTASLTKVPDMNGGNEAPTAALQFKCIRANAAAA